LTHGRAIFAKKIATAWRLNGCHPDILWRALNIAGEGKLSPVWWGAIIGKRLGISGFCREVPKFGSPSDRTATQKKLESMARTWEQIAARRAALSKGVKIRPAFKRVGCE
jgi:hypothetical protein